MKRREFITLVGGAAAGAFPCTAFAQQLAAKRIGVLNPYAENDPEAQRNMTAFRTRLAQLGWNEGRNLQIDYRWTGGDASRIRPSAKELVTLHLDVIVTRATPAVAALLQETRTIPIVFVNVSDPVGEKLVQSFARPGGNATGFTSGVGASLGSKWLGLLKEIVPRADRIAVIYNPMTAGGSGGDFYVRLIQNAAASIAARTITFRVQNATEIERAMSDISREPNSVMVAVPDITITNNRAQIISLAAKYRIPVMYPYRYFVHEGGLISYGTDIAETFRQAAGYVDRILRGSKPGELPIQQPTKFELVINRKTANAFGLAISDKMIAIADEVIE